MTNDRKYTKNEIAFLREVKEETGFCYIVVEELGYIEEHKNHILNI